MRNWLYTLAFAIFVPTGLRFAILAWKNGDWFDKPLSILAGIVIGITAVATLVRVWTVPPQRTLQASAVIESEEGFAAPANASQLYASAVRQAAQNREIARGAAALGPTHRWPFGS